MSADAIALVLIKEGLRAEVLHTEPEKINVWDPSTTIWDVTTFLGPFGDTKTESDRILKAIRPE